jgi:mannose-1-phosphate guanylyltransferase
MAAAGELYAMPLPGFWMDIGQPPDYLSGLAKFLPALLEKQGDEHGGFSASPAPRSLPQGPASTAEAGTAVADGCGSRLVAPEEAKARGFTVHGCVLLHPSAVIGAGACLGPNVTVGANSVIGPCARLQNAAVFERCSVGAGAFIAKAIVGWESRVGDWARVEAGCVFGCDVEVKPELVLHNVQVLPNKEVKESAANKILM